MTDTATAGWNETRQPWSAIAAGFAGTVAHDSFSRGDLAELRRLDPDNPDATAFWRLLARHELLGNETLESKWALILHGIALMTRSGGSDAGTRPAHNPGTSVGRALFLGGADTRQQGFYSEARLNRLLTARGPVLRTLLRRTFRMLAAAGQSFDWREMATFILNDGYDEHATDQVRRHIARTYYQAERLSAQDKADNN